MKKRKSTKRAPKRRGLSGFAKFEMRGISKMIIILAIAVLLVGGGVLYFMSQKGINPAASLIGKTLNPNCEYKDPDLCKFFNNWKEMSNYSMKSIMKANGTTSESTYEISGTDKTHMVSSENGKESYNTITIGDTTYTKDYLDNKWFKQTFKADPNATPTPKEDTKITFDDKKMIEEKIEYKALGKEACGSLTCFKYQEISANDNGTTSYIWFDDKEYVLRRNMMTDKTGTESDSTFSYDSVNIATPSPVKEGEPGVGTIPNLNPEDKKALEQMQKDAASQQQAQPEIPQDFAPPADSSSDNSSEQ